jgi:hypothetical protein
VGKSESPGRAPRTGLDPWPGRLWHGVPRGSLARPVSLGSLRRWLLRAPSLSGALFLCRETRKLPFDCGSPRPGTGERQRGSEWQRGKGRAPPVPAACRVRSPLGAAAEAAAAAVPARRRPRAKRAAPAGRAERAQQVAPRGPSAAPCFVWVLTNAERDAEPWSGVGLVDHTEPTAGEWVGADVSLPLRTNAHSTFQSPLWKRK